MAEPVADNQAYNEFIIAYAKHLRENDSAPASRPEWMRRREALRSAMFAAMGPFPKEPSPLEPKVLGEIKHPNYVIEKLIFQSRPNVWVTASFYRPINITGKRPAVLV